MSYYANMVLVSTSGTSGTEAHDISEPRFQRLLNVLERKPEAVPQALSEKRRWREAHSVSRLNYRK